MPTNGLEILLGFSVLANQSVGASCWRVGKIVANGTLDVDPFDWIDEVRKRIAHTGRPLLVVGSYSEFMIPRDHHHHDPMTDSCHDAARDGPISSPW